MSMMGSGPTYSEGTKKVTVMICGGSPTLSGPTLQGNVAGTQEFVTNTSPAGVSSVMVAPATSDGPLFVTVSVWVTLVPGVVGVAGPVFPISRSAMGVTSTEALTVNGGSPPSAPSGSIVAVFVTSPCVFGAALTWKLTTADWPGSI